MTSIRSTSDDKEEVTLKVKESNDYRSGIKINEGKQDSSGRRHSRNHSTEKSSKAKVPEPRTSRTASEGASGRGKSQQTYKKALDPGNKRSEETTDKDLLRSVSVSAVVGTKDKKLPAIPPGNRLGDKSSKTEDVHQHGYDNVKKVEDKPHKYTNVELSEETGTRSNSILEPKYDEVDMESKKKKENNKKSKSKGKAKDTDHYYHTLEESERVDAEATNEEEYSSPKSKSLVVNKVVVQDKKGKVLSTEENATVKEDRGSTRAKSCSGKKKPSLKGGKGKDPEYDQPTHNTLPHRSTAGGEKDNTMQTGKLTTMFDDPMYLASTEVATPQQAVVQLVPVKESSPKHARSSSDALVLRKPEKSKEQDQPEYEEPNEKKSNLSKDDLYSSRLFDDPKYEGGIIP